MALFGRRRGPGVSFEERSRLPGLADFDMKVQPGWLYLNFDKPKEVWLSDSLGIVDERDGALPAEARATLRGELARVWDNFSKDRDPVALVAARVPQGELHVVCTSFARFNGARAASWPQASPENYARELVKPDSGRGLHVDTVDAWRDEFPNGTSVTAYFLMHYDMGGRQWTEERVSSGYFPHASSQMIEFAFTTPAVGANGDHLPMLVREMMQSVTVVLDK